MEHIEIDKIKQKYKNVPLGMSKFQIRHMVCNEPTPERAYRTAVLNIKKEIDALEYNEYTLRKNTLEIKSIKNRLEKNKYDDPIDKELDELNLKERENSFFNAEVLVKDSLDRVEEYAKILSELPDVDKDKFEAGELNHWQRRLINDAVHEVRTNGRVDLGTAKNLHKIGVNWKCEGKNLFVERGDPVKLLEEKK